MREDSDPTERTAEMTVVAFPEPERAKLASEILTLAHELVHRAEIDPSAPVVGQISRQIEATSTRLSQP